jgi:MFS family permease
MRRLLALVGAIVFVDTMFFAALTPLLPHYAHTFDLGKAGAGALQAMYPLGALLAAIPAGMAAARIGVKGTVLIGLTLLALTTAAFGLASSVWTLDLARFVQGVSSAFSWTGALAWLVAAAPPVRRGRLIGSAFGAAIAGALFGPAIGAVASYTGTGSAFGVVALLAVGLAIVAGRMPAPKPDQPQPVSMLFRSLGMRRIQIPIWLCLLPALLFGNLSVLAPLRLSGLGWSAAGVAGTYLVMAAVEATWSPFLGRATDHFGRLPALRAALLASAVACLVLPWPQNAWLLAVVIVGAGFSYGSFWTPAMSMITDEAEASGLDYGYAFALVNMGWAPGQAAGAAIGGALASVTSDAVVYVGLSGLCLVTLLSLAGYRDTASPLAAER